MKLFTVIIVVIVRIGIGAVVVIADDSYVCARSKRLLIAATNTGSSVRVGSPAVTYNCNNQESPTMHCVNVQNAQCMMWLVVTRSVSPLHNASRAAQPVWQLQRNIVKSPSIDAKAESEQNIYTCGYN